MKIALDIDDTITKYPAFFAELSEKYEVIIITSRQNTDESKIETLKLLDHLNINFNKVYYCDWTDDFSETIPDILEGAEILLYQKVLVCQKEQVDVIFDDDPIVQRLIKHYLPSTAIFSPI